MRDDDDENKDKNDNDFSKNIEENNKDCDEDINNSKTTLKYDDASDNEYENDALNKNKYKKNSKYQNI